MREDLPGYYVLEPGRLDGDVLAAAGAAVSSQQPDRRYERLEGRQSKAKPASCRSRSSREMAKQKRAARASPNARTAGPVVGTMAWRTTASAEEHTATLDFSDRFVVST